MPKPKSTPNPSGVTTEYSRYTNFDSLTDSQKSSYNADMQRQNKERAAKSQAHSDFLAPKHFLNGKEIKK